MEKVKPGDNLNIKATDWNKIADVVNNQSPRTGSGVGSKGDNGNMYVLVNNGTELAIPIYGIVELDGLAINPVVRANTYQEPVFNAILPTTANYNNAATYGIAQEPIAIGTVGRVCINGVTLCVAYNTGYYRDGKYILPSFAGNFVGTTNRGATNIKIISETGAYTYLYAVMITMDTPDAMIPAITNSDYQLPGAKDESGGFYRVYLYENGYTEGITGEAIMYLAQATYGIPLPQTKIMVYRRGVRMVTGEIIEVD